MEPESNPSRIDFGDSKYFSSRDITQIDDHLFLGNLDVTVDLVTSRLNIQNIVQLVVTDNLIQVEERIKFLKIPIRGGRTTNIRPVLLQALTFIHSAISSGENVLVHCKHGRNRSASVVVAYIMAVKNMECWEAQQYVVGRRPIVQLKPQTIQYLQKDLGIEGIRNIIF